MGWIRHNVFNATAVGNRSLVKCYSKIATMATPTPNSSINGQCPKAGQLSSNEKLTVAFMVSLNLSGSLKIVVGNLILLFLLLGVIFLFLEPVPFHD